MVSVQLLFFFELKQKLQFSRWNTTFAFGQIERKSDLAAGAEKGICPEFTIYCVKKNKTIIKLYNFDVIIMKHQESQRKDDSEKICRDGVIQYMDFLCDANHTGQTTDLPTIQKYFKFTTGSLD